MVFLNPLAFWGFFLLLIPILIHLFEFRRVKKVEFSNVAFLKRIETQTGAHNKLKKLLTLILRLIAIAALVMAFALPQTVKNTETSLEKAIFLDNSYSMKVRNREGGELLYSSIEAVRHAYEQERQAGKTFRVYTNNWSNRILLNDVKSLTELDRLIYSPGSIEIPTVLDRLKEESEVFIMSDFQKGTFGDPMELKFDSLQKISFVKVTPGNTSNLFVDSAFLDAPVGIPSQNTLHLILRNVGDDIRENVLIRLKKGDIQISSIAVDIEGKSSKNVEFLFSSFTEISGDYTVEIDDPVLTFDNEFFLSIPKSKKLSVLIINDRIQNRFLELAFGNSHIFDVKSRSINAIDIDLKAADLLVLNELDEIPEWFVSRLRDSDRPILIIPSIRSDVSSYNRLNIHMTKSDDTIRYQVSRKSLSNPIFNGVFNSILDQMSLPDASVIYSISGSESVIQLESRQPFVSKKENVIFFSCPISDRFTSLHKHSLFVPLLYQLVVNDLTTPVLGYSLDRRTIELEGDSLIVTGKTVLSGMSGSYFPSFQYAGKGVSMEVPDVLSDPGIYYLINGSDTIRSISLNTSKTESDIESYSVEELEAFIPEGINATVLSIEDLGSDQNFLEPDSGLALWKYALLLALLCMISEILVLRFVK